MMSPESFDAAFLDRLRRGDDDAARQVFERFTRRLIALARSQFDASQLLRADAEDVVQSVFKSFFWRLGRGRFRVADWEGLWALLALMTVRKCHKRSRFHNAARRDARRDVRPNANDPGSACANLPSREPTPLEAAVLGDLIGRLLDGLAPHERQILELHLQGYTIGEISERCGRPQRTVRRMIARGRNRLVELDEGGARSDL